MVDVTPLPGYVLPAFATASPGVPLATTPAPATALSAGASAAAAAASGPAWAVRLLSGAPLALPPADEPTRGTLEVEGAVPLPQPPPATRTPRQSHRGHIPLASCGTHAGRRLLKRTPYPRSSSCQTLRSALARAWFLPLLMLRARCLSLRHRASLRHLWLFYLQCLLQSRPLFT